MVIQKTLVAALKSAEPIIKEYIRQLKAEITKLHKEVARLEIEKMKLKNQNKKGNRGTLMKIITLHPLVIVVEGFYASASEIRRTWDTSPCDGTGNGRLPDIP